MEVTAAFADVWTSTVSEQGDRPFLIFDSPSRGVGTWSYAEFDAVVDRAAAALAERGVEPGAGVHLALANSTSFVAAWLAATKLGAWVVPGDPGSAERELAEHLSRTAPVVGLCATTRRDPYVAAAKTTQLGHVIEVD